MWTIFICCQFWGSRAFHVKSSGFSAVVRRSDEWVSRCVNRKLSGIVWGERLCARCCGRIWGGVDFKHPETPVPAGKSEAELPPANELAELSPEQLQHVYGGQSGTAHGNT